MRVGLIVAVIVVVLGIVVLVQQGGLNWVVGSLLMATTHQSKDGDGPQPAPSGESATLRYRLTVDLLADGHPVSGSVVQELGFYENRIIRPPLVPSRIGILARGEALLIDLGQLGGLLVPIEQRGADMPYETMIFWACAPLAREEWSRAYVDRVRPLLAAGCTVPALALPMFVFIPDLKSYDGFVRAPVDDMSSLVGGPVEFVAARLELTDEELGATITDRLPWLRQIAAANPHLVPVQSGALTITLRIQDFLKERF